MSTPPLDRLSPLLSTQEQILALLSAANPPPPPPPAPLPPAPLPPSTDSKQEQVTRMESAPVRPGTPIEEIAETTESGESLDPLSHLTHIFDKIRKQVIEWGEDANWKIDVFLLPNEDGAPTPGLPPHDPQLLSQGPATPVRPPAAIPRIDLTGSPPRFPGGPHDIDMVHSSAPGSRGFALQPPPSDLSLSKGLGLPESLTEHDIKRMNEAEAKQMLSLAIRQIREQQESLSQATLDLESMQRLSAKREREAEARLEVEKQIMERDAFVLSRKLRETSITLMEKDREIKDVQYQLETGKRLIKERSEERRKRIDDQGSVPPRSSSGRPEASSEPAPGTPGASNPSLPFHQHRHRHVHYHRHHHRHLRRKANAIAALPTGTDSLDNLALLASQVLSREPLPPLKTGSDTDAEGDKKKRQIDDRDRGLQLRPVKRLESNGYQKDSIASQSVERRSKVDPTIASTVSNGKLKAQDYPTQPQSSHPVASTMRTASQQSTSAVRPFVKPQPQQQQQQYQQHQNNDRLLNKHRR
ncbi:hypothetical protein FBU30_009839 [Linnemannia zychae]|nr:hypothetical protein FBU30_009839 [Linnemannia zychae]